MGGVRKYMRRRLRIHLVVERMHKAHVVVYMLLTSVGFHTYVAYRRLERV